MHFCTGEGPQSVPCIVVQCIEQSTLPTLIKMLIIYFKIGLVKSHPTVPNVQSVWAGKYIWEYFYCVRAAFVASSMNNVPDGNMKDADSAKAEAMPLISFCAEHNLTSSPTKCCRAIEKSAARKTLKNEYLVRKSWLSKLVWNATKHAKLWFAKFD